MSKSNEAPSSSTVDDYLKAILLAQEELADGQLVAIGRLAAAVGVSVTAASRMVRTLAEAGLVEHERYGGVRLLPAGLRRATSVVRRHRLIELFLVRTLGMPWDEVHTEAEHLEHAVSDRVIDRIDHVLGHPTVDPHGDAIPDRNGNLVTRRLENLLSCPVNTPVVVSRVTDQDPAFLRFVASSKLEPGSVVKVEARDDAAGTVRITRNDQSLTIGARAAAKLQVEENTRPRRK